MKVTNIIGRIFHHSDGRVERSVQIFDGTTMLAAVGSSIKEKKADPVVIQPTIKKYENKISDSYLEPLIRIGVVKTH